MPRRSPHPSPEADQLDRDVGAAIRRFRTDLGLSQHALAARLSLSGQQLQKYESGATPPSEAAVGLIQTAVAAFLPFDYVYLVLYVLLAVILVVRREGLSGATRRAI